MFRVTKCAAWPHCLRAGEGVFFFVREFSRAFRGKYGMEVVTWNGLVDLMGDAGGGSVAVPKPECGVHDRLPACHSGDSLLAAVVQVMTPKPGGPAVWLLIHLLGDIA